MTTGDTNHSPNSGGLPRSDDKPHTGVVATSYLEKSHEEMYFALSMTLLRSMQASDLPSAIQAAEALHAMMGGQLPEDSPASLLLQMRRQIEAFQKEKNLEEGDVSEEESESEDTEESESESESEDTEDSSSSHSDSDDEEEGEVEDEKPLLVQQALHAETAEAGVAALLQHLKEVRTHSPLAHPVQTDGSPPPSGAKGPRKKDSTLRCTAAAGRSTQGSAEARHATSRPRGCSKGPKRRRALPKESGSGSEPSPLRHSLEVETGDHILPPLSASSSASLSPLLSTSPAGTTASRHEMQAVRNVFRTRAKEELQDPTHPMNREGYAPAHELELCEEDLRVLLQIEAEVAREMDRLSIIRRNR